MDIFELILKNDLLEIEKWIFNKKTNKNVTHEKFDSPLIYSLLARNEEAAMIFIKNDLYVDVPDRNGRTPLCYTNALNFHLALIALIEKGADVNYLDCDKSVPLNWSNPFGQMGRKILLESGASLFMNGTYFKNDSFVADWLPECSKKIMLHYFSIQKFLSIRNERHSIVSLLNVRCVFKFSQTYKFSFKE